jgi:hypothetical protein
VDTETKKQDQQTVPAVIHAGGGQAVPPRDPSQPGWALPPVIPGVVPSGDGSGAALESCPPFSQQQDITLLDDMGIQGPAALSGRIGLVTLRDSRRRRAWWWTGGLVAWCVVASVLGLIEMAVDTNAQAITLEGWLAAWMVLLTPVLLVVVIVQWVIWLRTRTHGRTVGSSPGIPTVVPSADAQVERPSDPSQPGWALPMGLAEDGDRRAAYQESRRRQRKTFWWIEGILCLALVAVPVMFASTTEGTAAWEAGGYIWIGSVFAMFLVACLYVGARRSTRVDAFERNSTDRSVAGGSVVVGATVPAKLDPGTNQGPIATNVDRFPANRLVNAESAGMYVLAGVFFGVLLGALPWVVVSDQVDNGQLSWSVGLVVGCVLASIAGVGAVILFCRRLYQEGVSEVAGGLRLVSLTRSRQVPWADITGIKVQQHLVSTKYESHLVPQIAIETRRGPWANSGTQLSLATSHERERARHNIRVADRWARAHHLPADDGLAEAVRYADGQISSDDLIAAADPG